MSQTPPNPGWQGGPQGPGQQWNPGPPQGPGQQQWNPGPPQGPGQQWNPGPPQGPGQQQWNPGPPQGPGQPPQGYSQQNFPQGGAPVKPKSKTKVIVASVVGLAVVAAGVGAALFLFRGATPAAAQGLPDNVTFAAEINLAPAAADQLALKSIMDKYPSLEPSEDFGTDYKHALYAALTSTSDDAPDYETKIKPWLGDSVAFGSIGTTEDEISLESNVVVAIETTDRKAAEEFATAEFDNVQVEFIDDLMVLLPTDSEISLSDIKDASLADSELYKADMQRLGTDSLASVWIGPGAFEASLDALEDQGLSEAGFDPATLKGAHGAMGVKASQNKLTLEFQFASPNAPATAEVSDVSELAASLSGDSLFALAGGLPKDYSQLWELTELDPSVADSLSMFGIDGPEDLSALLGDKLSSTIDWDDEAQQPIIGATFESSDQARQQEILDEINASLGEMGGVPGLELTQQDGKGVVAFGQSADEVLNPPTRLGEIEAFKNVVGGKAQAVMYINIDALKSRSFFKDMTAGQDDATEILAPITAIGMTSNSTDGTSGEMFVHVTFE